MTELLDRLRAAPGAAAVLDAVAGEPGVHVVGGAVRDVLLDRAPRELDLVVEGDALAVARRAAERVGGEVRAHDRFGTATVLAPAATFDLTGARRERYPQPGALPEVELGASLEEDLARRDFTVNAIALGLEDGRLVAHPGAEEDLAAGRLRVLHPLSFADDPTRMLRLVRYAARLGFAAEPDTDARLAAAVDGGATGTVAPERLGRELRLLLREPLPAALRALERHGLGAAVLGAGFHAAGAPLDVVLELAPPGTRGDLAALAATLGPDAPLGALGFPGVERDVLRAAAAAPPLAPAPDAELWRRLRRTPVEAVAVAGARGDAATARRWLDELRHRRPAITGDDLLAAGLSGPAVGRGLEAAMAAHLAGAAPDRESQLRAALAAAS